MVKEEAIKKKDIKMITRKIMIEKVGIKEKMNLVLVVVKEIVAAIRNNSILSRSMVNQSHN
jgi:hypothetical protein